MDLDGQDAAAPSTTEKEQDESSDFADYNLPTDLTAFQLNTLYVIAQLSPAEGVAIQDALEELYPGAINHGRLYPGLDRLVEKGLITKQIMESDNRRNEYAITGRGEWATEEYSQFVQAMVK